MSNTKAKKTAAKVTKLATATGTRPRKTTVSAIDRSKMEKSGGDNNQSKQGRILTLLRRAQGASVEEMQNVSDWQPHSVRGFLSGTVKRKLGLNLSSARNRDGERRYMVVG